MAILVRSQNFYSVVFGMMLLLILINGCDDDSPTAPDITPTPVFSTPTPSPTTQPSATPTTFTERFYRGSSFYTATGQHIGSIEYTLYPDRRVAGTIRMLWICNYPSGTTPEEHHFNHDFQTWLDTDERFTYDFRYSTSPHYSAHYKVECTTVGLICEGTWECSESVLSVGGCTGSGTWQAWCESGC